MTFEQVATSVAARLDQAGIPYMLTGALAVSYHGIPRSTHDVDIVVLVALPDVARIKAALEPDFPVATESIKAALREGSMFNTIHEETGLKVDFWIRKDDQYGREAFARRRRYPYGEMQVSISAPEDAIIAKLDWYRMSGIDKHYSDALGIVTVQQGMLDTDYIRRWCQAKGLADLWYKVEHESHSAGS